MGLKEDKKSTHISRSKRRRTDVSRMWSRSRSRSSSRSRSRSSGSHSPQRSFLAQEERRVLFIGRILKEMTMDDLKTRFQRFGTIISIDFNEKTDNFAYITYASSADAYQAVVYGKDQTLFKILRYDRRKAPR
ncbi:peroxisome proliferator-activated receptor gamma coactivator 1-alpha-like [Homalodisca vitripennis]|uniref:peroxisome proliferator-activated receptor gamma coactivator 1-alpha-like n=1 Tax=Homalodisca vitripennis TaxID=197043 RepID=UPI001EEB171A|nr:peroxisome proliferator-activated receptor gamma coactivator 1-alpha-like [Homalodisca vitripennis]XP_046685027.1 peroxisome proliferator-activated receptor gamma coactivator 1-alpha-like [Homalodisca vitripennis]XP_046685028.1 peroxisome proliferator-activated receptor gamma coactivator 1-alpha-like [Homalodisca vitripennis]XP_046685029.1 peroxisome proliferator-activated receptor gamma coactivator 1-alpha-like [Homalodisca vitripennis]XP_046685030.1 peroxisome proliferator-activated recept